MFGIGLFEIIVIAGAAILFIGPEKLPQVAKQFGRFFVQARRVTNEVKGAFDNVIQDAENEILEEKRKAVRDILDTVAHEPAPDYDEMEHENHAEDSHHERDEHFVEGSHGYDESGHHDPDDHLNEETSHADNETDDTEKLPKT